MSPGTSEPNGSRVAGCLTWFAEPLVSDEHRALRLDVTDEADIGNAVDQLRYEAERPDILVNDAGIGGPADPIGESTTGGIDRVLDTNLRGSIRHETHTRPPPGTRLRPRREYSIGRRPR